MGGLSDAQKNSLNAQQKEKIEETFKQITGAYNRLDEWISERDLNLDEKIINNEAPGVQVDQDDGSVTHTLGALRLRGKMSQLNK